MDTNETNGQRGASSGAAPMAPTSPFGVVGRKVRAIFAATTQGSQATAPRGEPAPADVAAANPAEAPTASGGAPLVIIRNCSTKQILDALIAELGGEADVSGRYFAPEVQDVARIREVAASRELFVKESRVRDVLVLDLMVDRTIHPYPPPMRRAPWPPRRYPRNDA